MRELPESAAVRVLAFREGIPEEQTDTVAAEWPLTLYVNDEEFATLVCTPTHLKEMTVGFLASEGVIEKYEDIADLYFNLERGLAYAELVKKTAVHPALFSKRRISSCCGKSRQSFYFASDARTARPVSSSLTLTPEECRLLMDRLQELSALHRETGGVHNAALYRSGTKLCAFSDIGRHNALDKIHGHCLLHGVDPRDTILLFSGRISSEVVLKAAKIGSSLLLSKSAPTDLALRLAEELGITAVGFIRGNRLNVYTHVSRIAGSDYL